MFVTHPSESERIAERFAEYVSAPVLTQIGASFDGFDTHEVEPRALPDLLAERPIYLFGKWSGDAEGTIEISGRSGDSEYSQTLRVEEASHLAGSRVLEYVWARERVRQLSDYNALWSDGEKVTEITRLGLKHALLSPYTSFVAVDEVVRKAVDEQSVSVNQPLALPEGVSNSAVGSGQSIPVTPEPEMWALMICSVFGLGWVLLKRKRILGIG